MYDFSEIRKGLKVTIDGQPYNVIAFQFVKPGKGQAFNRTKLRNLLTGAVLERTFKSNERLEKCDVESRNMQYLYPEGESLVFMDTKNYEQVTLTAEQLGENKGYLLPESNVDVLFWGEKPIDVTPPVFVELKITSTEPGFKGDTSGNTLKPAVMETGITINVPLFVGENEVIRIDTRTGEYVERVNKR